MSKIIISYRKDDAKSVAGRLHDFMCNRYGDSNVRLGLAGVIQPGDDYLDAIETAVKACDAYIVLIGPQWANGGWLNNSEDYDHFSA